MKSLRTLYVCYFGLREPLVQTQVLPYLRVLAARGIGVHLLTFEPDMKRAWNASAEQAERERLAGEGITWFALPYHKSPSVPATLYDIATGARAVMRLVREHDIDVIHARAHIPLAMALVAKRFTKCALIFDIRGLMAEEYADAGVWTAGSLKFRVIKKLEAMGIKKADQLVVLTEAMKSWMLKNQLRDADHIEVIPCCVDFAGYGEAESQVAQTDAPVEIIYAGSVTGLYLLEEMGKFFLEVRAQEPRAFLRVLTISSVPEASERLRRAGLEPKDFWVGKVSAHEVPQYLQRARLGLSFRKSTFSQVAASPTKIAEYLAAGLPVVSNAGIGDVDDLLQTESVGVVVRDFTAPEFTRAVEAALVLAGSGRIRAHCVEVARRYFDLDMVGGSRYENVYKRIANAQAAH
jgi:glycosyltransferase involved in cell wall biosynthesis